MSKEPQPPARPVKTRLRTRLTSLLVLTLGLACLIMGASNYLSLERSLMSQVEEELADSSHRALFLKPHKLEGQAETGPAGLVPTGGNCQMEDGRTILQAPGQAAGTITLCSQDGNLQVAGRLGQYGQVLELSQSDQARLQEAASLEGTQRISLEAGDYLLLSHSTDQGYVLVGLSLAETQQTLNQCLLVMVAGSGLVMLLTGLLGSWIIRRTMHPLERVSGVASAVAQLDLAQETLPEASRVQAEDADPQDEVGAVGYALNQLLDNVQSALEARSRTEEQMRVFIADASHELRTPLAAIRGYADMLTWTERLSDQGKKSLDRVSSQTERMSRLVEDLLLLARLDEGLQPQLEPVDLTELLLENVMDLQVAAPDHDWQLQLPEEPVEVLGDRSQLQQVLLNLLSNARKHTDPGTQVTASLAVATNGREAIVGVRDKGPGIAPDFIDKIFDRFTRADAARSGSDGTSGLGLPIVKAIVEAHGGSIDVVSEPGNTEFSVRLPLVDHED